MPLSKRDIQINLEALSEFRDTVVPILETLDRYKWDLQNEQDTNTEIYGIIDFSDLFRYLHPLLDLTAYRSPEKFYSEQVALQYLFTKDTLNLVLLPVYVEEYRLSLRSTQVQLSEFAILPEDAMKRRVIRMDKKLQVMLEELEASSSNDPLHHLSGIHKTNQDLLDILFDNARSKVLQRGSAMYDNMVSEGVLQPAESITGLSSDDLLFQMNSRYKGLYDRLETLRPGRRRANVADAKAYHTALCLNRKYYHPDKPKKIFLFITSSTRVIQAFDTDIATELHGDKDLFESMGTTSIIRSPEYLIIRFLFKTFSSLPSGVDLDGFYDLLSRYLNVADKLDVYFGQALSGADIETQNFNDDYSEALELKQLLLPCVEIVTKFGNSPYYKSSMHSSIASMLGLKSLLLDVDLSEEDIRNKIKQAVLDPTILVDHFQENVRRLNGSIVELEQHLLSLFYSVGGPSVVYNVHIAESMDDIVKTKAKDIVAALSEQTEDSFRRAFRSLGELRLTHSNCADTFVLSSKVYRGMRAYREALEHAKRALFLSPGYSEALVEVGFRYRMLANTEKNPIYYNTAWNYFEKALSKGGDDPRVLRELMFLVWLATEEKYELPYIAQIGDTTSYLVEKSEIALKLSKDLLGKDSRLTITLMNDRAYYLALSSKEAELDEAECLIREAISLETNVSQRTIGAYEDTLGFILLRKLEQLNYSVEMKAEFFQQAMKLIRSAYRINPNSKATQRHMAQCVDLMLSLGYFHNIEINNSISIKKDKGE